MSTTIGEREQFRCQVKAVTGLAHIWDHPTCVITDKRILLSDNRGSFVQLLFSDVVAVWPERSLEPKKGQQPRYFVHIKTKMGFTRGEGYFGPAHESYHEFSYDPGARLELEGETIEDVYRLASQIEQAIMQM